MDNAMRGRLASPADARRFIEAGSAVFTVVSLATGKRLTFKMTQADDGKKPFFLSLMTGSDNEASFTYMGALFPPNMTEPRPSARSHISQTDSRWKALLWVLRGLYGEPAAQDRLMEQAELWHEGRCGACGRRLTVPQSIQTGFGPDCAAKMGLLKNR